MDNNDLVTLFTESQRPPDEDKLKLLRSLCIQMVNTVDDLLGKPRTIPSRNERRARRVDKAA